MVPMVILYFLCLQTIFLPEILFRSKTSFTLSCKMFDAVDASGNSFFFFSFLNNQENLSIFVDFSVTNFGNKEKNMTNNTPLRIVFRQQQG